MFKKYLQRRRDDKFRNERKAGLGWALSEYFEGDMCIAEIESFIHNFENKTAFDIGIEYALTILRRTGQKENFNIDQLNDWETVAENQSHTIQYWSNNYAKLESEVNDPKKYLKFTPAEMQCGLNRVRWAELLINQLPKDHDGRNSWLLNYGSQNAVPKS